MERIRESPRPSLRRPPPDAILPMPRRCARMLPRQPNSIVPPVHAGPYGSCAGAPGARVGPLSAGGSTNPAIAPRSASPFLTAEWRALVMLQYEVPPELLRPLVPRGTELESWQGRTVVSLVGFRFLDTRLLGAPIPWHRDFEELNLRFYVRRRTPQGWRRAVVFVREVVPRRAIALVARLRIAGVRGRPPALAGVADEPRGPRLRRRPPLRPRLRRAAERARPLGVRGRGLGRDGVPRSSPAGALTGPGLPFHAPG
jgi:hypothetical protein